MRAIVSHETEPNPTNRKNIRTICPESPSSIPQELKYSLVIPSNDVIRAMTKIIEGSEYKISTKRIISESIRPPRYPDTAPQITPIKRLTNAPTAPTRIDT